MILCIRLVKLGLQLNIEILDRFQAKFLRTVANSPGFVTNDIITTDLEIPSVKTEIRKITFKYVEKLEDHVNPEAALPVEEQTDVRRLRRFKPLDCKAGSPPDFFISFSLSYSADISYLDTVRNTINLQL